MSLTDYLASLAAAGRSPHTVSAYDADLRGFEPTPAGYRRYLDGLAGYAPASAARKVCAARSYCRWLGATGGWERVLVPPRQPARAATALGDDDLARLVDAPRGASPLALRDRAMLRLLADAGCRASELVGMDVGHVFPTRSVVLAPGTDREREVPLDDATADALDAYVAHGRPRLLWTDIPALFVNHRGERLTRQGLWVIVQGLCRRAGVPPATPSMFRDAAARRLVGLATDPRDAQFLLGHTNIATTLRYRRAA